MGRLSTVIEVELLDIAYHPIIAARGRRLSASGPYHRSWRHM